MAGSLSVGLSAIAIFVSSLKGASKSYLLGAVVCPTIYPVTVAVPVLLLIASSTDMAFTSAALAICASGKQKSLQK
ncbi:hypothetical protein M4A92_13420 [Caldibacillus thermoamylovorans]|uniref:hypothetical protein n=1 Tax=Caldibacillus thermoamylovorans TaxID=35841 RepID=UPI00203CEB92|nr:hypothetical protein [Caldibacillus thermoamylovorans]MCM3799613.1 hypothetical protein [Caldibacillus thermoamylovorans]